MQYLIPSDPSRDDVKTKEVENFIAKAWCVSGDVKLKGFLQGERIDEGKHTGGLYEVHDAKRGCFYIAILHPILKNTSQGSQMEAPLLKQTNQKT